MIKCVVFDVGETLIDETRLWTRWAARLGVTPSVLLGLIGACAERGQNVEAALQIIRPGMDAAAEEAAWEADEPDSLRGSFDADDLYDDVRPTFAALKERGIKVIVAGNQPAKALEQLRAMRLGEDAMANSAELGVEKPAPEFFVAVLRMCAGLDPATSAQDDGKGEPCAKSQDDGFVKHVLYVGDRVDNDVLPAYAAGMRTALIRRGPYGYLHATRPELKATGTPVLNTLKDIVALLD